uniref:Dynamin N-terminal domain-containing protein n=1 Tax=Entomoneis paludosa TaxID=265537 RepID=A0A7S3DUI3_9STRA|mmetsp:Transcript_38235/g.79524  ORF Transcript_38235/g.79524 Transcript_38235/m.79524 type:complete len:588 (+) Transcript_38235:3293-5056(+)
MFTVGMLYLTPSCVSFGTCLTCMRSVGKSTILNTLLGDFYNPTSMGKKETAGIREFRIHHQQNGKRKADTVYEDRLKRKDQVLHIHNSIRADNTSHHRSESLGQTFVFDLDVPHNFWGSRDNRPDAILSLFDIPGLNGSGKDSYCEWVTDNWSSFDSMMIVLDATTDCRTGDVAMLLEVVKKCQREIRELPLVFVTNKVDDPDDMSLMEMVSDMESYLRAFFDGVLEIKSYGIPAHNEPFPRVFEPADPKSAIFVPISAQYALLFEAAKSGWGKPGDEGFFKFQEARVEFSLIDKFGSEEAGKSMWMDIVDDHEKYRTVFHLLSRGSSLLGKRSKQANFETLKSILEATVCGKDRQTKLLRAQLTFDLEKPVGCDGIFARLTNIKKKASVLGLGTAKLTEFFWTTYASHEEKAKSAITESPQPMPSSIPADLLREYYKFVLCSYNPKNNEETKKIQAAFGDWVRFTLELVCVKFGHYWKRVHMENNNGSKSTSLSDGKSTSTWETLSYDQWAEILGSILLAAEGRKFKSLFRRELIFLRQAEIKVAAHTSSLEMEDCGTSHGRNLLTSKTDWGYVINSYCEHLELVS